MAQQQDSQMSYFKHDTKALLSQLDKEKLIKAFKQMLLIRNFETRAEAAYQQGKIGGFFHSYIGQEAIQVAAVLVMGQKNWWATSYRCHALALLLGAAPNELMAELYGRKTGNAMGRGGSMHFFTERLLGGFGIVGGQIPIATGAAFTLKYQDNHEEVSVCFLGDGAVVQGSFHESLNLAALWSLPCIYVIENNRWGMGTAVERAVSVKKLAEEKAPSYGMKSYTLDGSDFFNCYAGFEHIHKEVLQTSRPVLVEVVTERFKGHSISDPGLYRSKEELRACMENDPIILFENELKKANLLNDEEIKQFDKEAKQIAVAAMKFADESPWPDVATLGQDIFAPEDENICQS